MTQIPLGPRTTRASDSRWRNFLVAFAVLFTLLGLWAVGMPISSAPDEPSHIVRAVAVAHGDLTGRVYPTDPSKIQVIVPQWASNSYNLACFAYQPNTSAACQPATPQDADRQSSTPTTAGVNSPVFYAIVGLPTLVLSGTPALYAMRLMSAVVCGALLSFMFMAVWQLPGSRWSVAAAAIAVTPMVLFLGGSVNPNGMEVAATGALTATMIAAMRTPSTTPMLWERGAIVVCSAALLAGTRNIALVWILVALACALLLSHAIVLKDLLKHSATWAAAGVGALAVIASLVWYLKPAITTATTPTTGAKTGVVAAFTTMIAQFFDFARDWIGNFGWLDRPAPALAVVVWTTLITVLVASALMFCRGRARIAVLLVVVGLVLIPAFSQAAVVHQMGFIWQGRYTLALAVCLLLVAGVALDAALPRALFSAVGSRALALALVMLSIAQIASYLWALKRYVVGASTSWITMITHPAWQPPLGWEALTGIMCFTLAVVGWSLLRSMRTRTILAPQELPDNHTVR